MYKITETTKIIIIYVITWTIIYNIFPEDHIKIFNLWIQIILVILGIGGPYLIYYLIFKNT